MFTEISPDYLIGLMDLANGRQDDARRQFMSCIQSGVFHARWYPIVVVRLSRIPLKQNMVIALGLGGMPLVRIRRHGSATPNAIAFLIEVGPYSNSIQPLLLKVLRWQSDEASIYVAVLNGIHWHMPRHRTGYS